MNVSSWTDEEWIAHARQEFISKYPTSKFRWDEWFETSDPNAREFILGEGVFYYNPVKGECRLTPQITVERSWVIEPQA
jgi:hypothetical protein